jgi:hypothetical protein
MPGEGKAKSGEVKHVFVTGVIHSSSIHDEPLSFDQVKFMFASHFWKDKNLVLHDWRGLVNHAIGVIEVRPIEMAMSCWEDSVEEVGLCDCWVLFL